MSHPCLSCGACCAAFRVAFHWLEADESGPLRALAVPLDPHRLAMQGTLVPPIRCAALRGEVGQATLCVVYAQRPSPCRDLKAAWEDGTASPQCDRARAAYGLAPLTPDSWA